MKKAKLYFQIDEKFHTKIYKPLKTLGKYEYNKNTKGFKWIFPLTKIKEVLALLGKPIEFSEKDKELMEIYSEGRKKRVKLGKVQGEGCIKVKYHPTKPNYFQVTSIREKKPVNTNVSFETVKSLWKSLKDVKVGDLVITSKTAELFCEELGIVDFNTYKHNRFNWKYFFGSRKSYMVFYSAIKVLCHFGVLEHLVKGSKSGIKKLKKNWVLQTEL
tara:strand:+ start:16120 stop:16767 length:648 start_codon:yes stop_codon:yes gene_type:complete